MYEVSPEPVSGAKIFTVVFLSGGTSNIHQTFSAFKRHAAAYEKASPIDLAKVLITLLK